jgi:hypothetical protein
VRFHVKYTADQPNLPPWSVSAPQGTDTQVVTIDEVQEIEDALKKAQEEAQQQREYKEASDSVGAGWQRKFEDAETERVRLHGAIMHLSVALNNPAVKVDPDIETGLIKHALAILEDRKKRIEKMGATINDQRSALETATADCDNWQEREEAAEKKWRYYENDFVLPMFRWARDMGFDLRKLVDDNPGKNCSELFHEEVLRREAKMQEDIKASAKREVDTRSIEGCLEKKLEALKAQIEAVIEKIPVGCQTRVREGGGLEDVAASLAVSVAKLTDAFRCAEYQREHPPVQGGSTP